MRSRSRSPSYRRHRSPSPRRYSRSPSSSKRRSQHSRSRSPPRNRKSDRYNSPTRRRNKDSNYRNHDNNNRRRPDHDRGKRGYEWGRPEDNEAQRAAAAAEQPVEKVQPNFGLSGKLAAETNTVNGVELKYTEPTEAAKPTKKWRLYVFKGNEQIDLLHIHRSSSLLIGRDRAVADIPVDHPSCSKQHAVIQYRLVNEKDEAGKPVKVVKPFIIDLESTNGTFLNGEKIPQTRYVEMRAQDVLKFGESTREYVLLHAEA